MRINKRGEGGYGGARSELDYHAIVIVTGEQAYVLLGRILLKKN
jgi:hypothetical protein